MAEYLVQGESITAVADAIREKGGTTAPLSFPAGMAEAVRGIQSGADSSLGITGATVGQIAKITAVDETGKPTKWEPVDIPSGGTDISLGITAATVDQTVKVKAVDASGVPTAWEAVDMAGGETWEKIAEIELAEAASLITISQDSAGRPFALKRVMIDCVVNIDQDHPMTYAKTLINGAVVSKNATYNFTGKEVGYYAFYAELIPGSGVLAWNVASAQNYNWECPIQKMGYKYTKVGEESAITKLTISPDDGRKNFGIAGTKINVLGVRA